MNMVESVGFQFCFKCGDICRILALVFPLLITGGCTDSSGVPVGRTDEDWAEAPPTPVALKEERNPDQTRLGLKLKPGDRFPLRKVVEQTLTQDTPQGTAQKIVTRLELIFAISVLAREENRSQLQVRYDRVKYSQRIGDEHLVYDSTRPPPTVPMEVRAYHDMVGDGFRFWLGGENQIVGVDGFTEFLHRCLRNVPEDQRNRVVLGIEAGSGESGIGNFVDNSIGLLPSGGIYEPGDTWERPSHIGRPVPMHVQTLYTLKQVDHDLAVVDIRGQITPSTTLNHESEATGIRVTVIGGETQGTCTIFRETGLPQRSRVEQNIDMAVLMSGAVRFNQRKSIVTTIESFPVNTGATPMVIHFGEPGPASAAPTRDSPPSSEIRPVSGP